MRDTNKIKSQEYTIEQNQMPTRVIEQQKATVTKLNTMRSQTQLQVIINNVVSKKQK